MGWWALEWEGLGGGAGGWVVDGEDVRVVRSEDIFGRLWGGI